VKFSYHLHLYPTNDQPEIYFKPTNQFELKQKPAVTYKFHYMKYDEFQWNPNTNPNQLHFHHVQFELF
jgi:hypothetical protein